MKSQFNEIAETFFTIAANAQIFKTIDPKYAEVCRFKARDIAFHMGFTDSYKLDNPDDFDFEKPLPFLIRLYNLEEDYLAGVIDCLNDVEVEKYTLGLFEDNGPHEELLEEGRLETETILEEIEAWKRFKEKIFVSNTDIPY